MFQAEAKDSVSTSMERTGRGEISPQKTKGAGGELEGNYSEGALWRIQGVRASGTDKGKVEKGRELHRPREGRNTGPWDPQEASKGDRTHTLGGTPAVYLPGTQWPHFPMQMRGSD